MNTRKLQVLKELETLFKISADRHKAELRRALNDEKLYTIAKRLSHGECISNEWTSQSARLFPLLPRLQQTTSATACYRILADHILKNSQSVLKLYPEPDDTKTVTESEEIEVPDDVANKAVKGVRTRRKRRTIEAIKSDEASLNAKTKVKPAQKNQDIVFLNNGYAVCTKHVQSN